ncbi:MAG TPA: exodeoxyribonuclease VII large subunit [Candidatus Bilophila faecipullorum]|uniref:Exodeoxyribonuclease 7 large subunit n=5 Tax=Bilophila TaxID=35832 RepID=A0A9D1U9N5_9BACT|nr:exodeoxyribonuclease VII large subunit [uncultured Bilophila sp.]HIW79844.1 exodeoxyribonuclease VII large subunit [Candidatus Bilophila faecipullorum]
MSILTVRQLTALIKDTVENGFPYVWVRGEVTNVSRPASGHVYFSLKDGDALLQAIWFRTDQKEREAFDPLTGEVFEDGPRVSLAATLKNGQQIVCAGRLTVYAPRGSYQLVVELAQDSGEGQLHLALEALKQKLAAKGYFSLERKREMPGHPCRVAVITAPHGAAVRDFLRLSAERGTGCEIHIVPVPVQGDDAPPRIAAALDAENRRGWAEVLVLIRGGGSLQDLWAFNDEAVAEAVFRSRIPVVAGIGHEVDTSIADMVADLRAATPSHAAHLLWPERRWYEQRVDELELSLSEAARRRFAVWDRQVETAGRALAWLSPERSLSRLAERFEGLRQRLALTLPRSLERADARLRPLEAAMHRATDGRSLERRLERIGDLGRRLEEAQSRRLTRAGTALDDAAARLKERGRRALDGLERRLEREEIRLAGLDPLAPLERGYACAMTEDGHFVRSVHDLRPGVSLTVKIRDGEADARVTAVRAKGETS